MSCYYYDPFLFSFEMWIERQILVIIIISHLFAIRCFAYSCFTYTIFFSFSLSSLFSLSFKHRKGRYSQIHRMQFNVFIPYTILFKLSTILQHSTKYSFHLVSIIIHCFFRLHFLHSTHRIATVLYLKFKNNDAWESRYRIIIILLYMCTR